MSETTNIHDLRLRARGLELVRAILAGRGASRQELDAFSAELDRVQHELRAALAQ
jgi:hypothetical protein